MTTPSFPRPSRFRRWLLVAIGGVLLSVTVVVLLLRRDTPAGVAPPAAGGMPGMDMGADGEARLTADQLREFGVTFGTVEVRPLLSVVRTTGVVTFDETRVAQVTLKVSGYVEELFVDFTGQQVRRGQALYGLYSPELVAAQEELLIAVRIRRETNRAPIPGIPSIDVALESAARRRLRLWDVSEAQIEDIIGRQEAQRTIIFASPVAGVVIEKGVQRGQAVEAGTALYTIADLTEVWIEAELREADAGLVTVGIPATIEFVAFPGRLIVGTVEYVYPTLQSEARTLTARISVRNPDGRIRPGMYATVHLSAPGHTGLVVPSDAIVRTGERTLVFVDMGGGRLEPKEIETGRAAGEQTEVLAGLEPGQRVVTSAQYLLESESNLGEVMKAMIGQISGPER